MGIGDGRDTTLLKFPPEIKTAANIKPSRRKAPQKSPTQRVEL